MWGDPVYDWAALKDTPGIAGGLSSRDVNLKLFDMVRIDHFRGLFAYWQVPAGDKTAANGKWVKCPYENFFNALFKRFTPQAIIAEDLGIITSDIKTFMKEHHLAGMRVLQFGFDGNLTKNSHFQANHIKNTIVYTGTHDNNTAAGWFTKEASPNKRKFSSPASGQSFRSSNKLGAYKTSLLHPLPISP